jgi:hypothetical protein
LAIVIAVATKSRLKSSRRRQQRNRTRPSVNRPYHEQAWAKAEMDRVVDARE